jgi:hypothetical protein
VGVRQAWAYQEVEQCPQSEAEPARSFENRDRLQSECYRCWGELDACEGGHLAKDAWDHEMDLRSSQCPLKGGPVGRVAASGTELETQVEEAERRQASLGGIGLQESMTISFRAQ